MDYLKIKNWERWQSYRADRGQPPWIKIHRCVMRNPEWVELTDAERGQLTAIWLLAADNNGLIPSSPKLIQKLCFMNTPLKLSKFIELGFICQNDAKMTPERRQDDPPEKSREEKSREEKNRDMLPPYQEIIEYLNKKAGKQFKHTSKETQSFIKARWNQGFKLDAFKFVIDIKCKKWLTDPKMVDYLRPQTLFGTKFESYLNETTNPLNGVISEKGQATMKNLEAWNQNKERKNNEK